MANPGNAIARRRTLKQLPDDVGAETELMGGPEDTFHGGVEEWRRRPMLQGEFASQPELGTPEIGLAPEMPNSLMARVDVQKLKPFERETIIRNQKQGYQFRENGEDIEYSNDGQHWYPYMSRKAAFQ